MLHLKMLRELACAILATCLCLRVSEGQIFFNNDQPFPFGAPGASAPSFPQDSTAPLNDGNSFQILTEPNTFLPQAGFPAFGDSAAISPTSLQAGFPASGDTSAIISTFPQAGFPASGDSSAISPTFPQTGFPASGDSSPIISTNEFAPPVNLQLVENFYTEFNSAVNSSKVLPNIFDCGELSSEAFSKFLYDNIFSRGIRSGMRYSHISRGYSDTRKHSHRSRYEHGFGQYSDKSIHDNGAGRYSDRSRYDSGAIRYSDISKDDSGAKRYSYISTDDSGAIRYSDMSKDDSGAKRYSYISTDDSGAKRNSYISTDDSDATRFLDMIASIVPVSITEGTYTYTMPQLLDIYSSAIAKYLIADGSLNSTNISSVVKKYINILEKTAKRDWIKENPNSKFLALGNGFVVYMKSINRFNSQTMIDLANYFVNEVKRVTNTNNY